MVRLARAHEREVDPRLGKVPRHAAATPEQHAAWSCVWPMHWRRTVPVFHKALQAASSAVLDGSFMRACMRKLVARARGATAPDDEAVRLRRAGRDASRCV